MFSTLDFCTDMLPQNKPRYLMGVGKPDDIVGAVLRGIDMFDCVMPTRSGRTAQAFTWRGPINLRNARHKDDPRPLDPAIQSPAAHYSRAYLHHLVRCEEILAPMLITWHNIAFYQALMQALRDAIEAGRCAAFAADFLENYRRGDIDPL